MKSLCIVQEQKSQPAPNASDAKQNLAAALELQKELQEARDLAAEKQRELTEEIAQLKKAAAELTEQLSKAEDARMKASAPALRIDLTMFFHPLPCMIACANCKNHVACLMI